MEKEITDFIRDIAIGIASNKFQNSIDGIKFFHCSRKVINEIDSAFNESLKDWVKLDEKKYSEIQIQTLIKENFLNYDTKTQNISDTNKLQRFFELFDYALSKRQIAFNFLTLKRNEARFNVILNKLKIIVQQNFEIQNKIENTKQEIQDFRFETNSKLDLIYETITNEKNIIEFDKEDSKDFKELFIPSIKSVDCYISRLVIKSDSKQNIEFFEIDFDNKTSNFDKEILSSNDALIILEGEPGIGKSIELNRVALSFWESNDTDLVPFYRNLRNFTIQDTIDSFLKVDLTEKFVNVLYILDGIDEIKDTGDFISKLNNFILNRRNRTSRFVLSCRSNILNKLSRTIEGKSIFRLKELNIEQSIALFENLVNIKCSESEKTNILNSNFIGDPFRIKLLADFYLSKGSIENDEYKLWSHYINKSLTIDEEVKFVKKEVFAPRILDDSKKSATVHELMNQFVMERDTLFKILEKDQNRLEQFTNCSLVDKEFEDNKFFFNHRKIQECLTAMFLSDLSIENISKLCQVSQTNIIKPQLENTILLLISTLSGSEKIKDLLKWIKENNPELLFKADLCLFTSIERTSMFKSYYNKQCIEKTLWIGTNSTISNFDLAQFGDSIESFDFLIDIINNKELNHRTRISAMNLIEEFKSINEGNLTGTIECILESDESISFKSAAIRLLNSLSLTKRVPLFDKIVNQYADESNKQWNRSLLEVLNTIPDIDQFFNYLKNEFNWANKIIKRNDNDNVHRGNSWIVPVLVLRLKSPDNFLELIPFYFNDYNLRSRESLREDIIKKCLEFENQINGFVLQLVTKLKDVGNLRTHFGEDSLFELITKTHQEFEVFKILFNPDKFEVTDQFILAKISNEETIDFLINSIKKTAINIEELKTFRNILANSGKRELARIFENQLLQFGQDIGKTPTDDDLHQNNNTIKKEVQENADLLFNNKELFEKISALLSENDIVTINAHNIRKIERSFYEIKNNWFRGLSCEFDILFASTYMFKSLPIEQLEKELQNSKRIQLIALKGMLESNKNAQFNFEISAENLKTVKQWITTEANNFDFENLVQFESFKSFTINRCSDYQFLKTIYYYLDIDEYSNCFNDSFLLNSIVFYRMEEFKPFSEGFDKLIAKITDKGLIKSKVKEAFNTQVISSSMERIIVWALMNNFDEVYDRIGEYLEFSSHSPGDELFDLYAEKNNEKAVELIKKIAIDTSVYNGWSALKKLSDIKSMHEYCINRCLDYLGSGQPEFYNKALGILLKMNHPSAITYFIEGIGKNPLSNIAHNLRADYFVDLELFMDNFEKLFIPIYQTKEVKDDFDRDWEFTENNTFFTQLMTNVLKHASNTVEAHERIRTKLDEVRIESNDDRINFFSNSISELLTNNYINLMSKPLSFEDALELTNRIIKS